MGWAHKSEIQESAEEEGASEAARGPVVGQESHCIYLRDRSKEQSGNNMK